MAHPSCEVDKTYVAEVDGHADKKLVDKLLAGVELDDGPVLPTQARIIASARDKSIVEVTIHEGRNRIVRRLLEHLGHPVRKLTRTEFGPVEIGQLKAGMLRDLTLDELGALLDRAKL